MSILEFLGRQSLLLASAYGMIAALVPSDRLAAQNTMPAPTTGISSTGAAESITVRAAKRLQKEKNSPSAVTELGAKAIAAAGVSGSVSSILRQAPSVNLYQQGIGDNAPVLTIRGLRGLEVATTLDGVPIQDLEAPGASYLANNIGSPISLSQISGVSIYPGVAYPNRNTFGTIGGTVAYDSLRPGNDRYVDVIGEVGSFQTWKSGIVLNSGSIDSPLGTGENAAKILASYANLQTAGFIDYTKARYNNMEIAFDKPCDDGLSKVQATVLYNTGRGLFENEPVPVPYLQKYGNYSNYAPNTSQDQEKNDYLTLILKNDKYMSDVIPDVGVSLFYLHGDNSTDTYGDINVFSPSGAPTYATVGAASPFINNPAGFGYQGYYGPGGLNYKAGVYPYNPLAAYPPGSKYCPSSVASRFTAAGQIPPCGLNSELILGSSDTYGIQPRMTIDPPAFFGIDQSIQIGGIVAKETSPSGRSYFGATPTVSPSASNLDNIFGGGFDGGTERTIFQGYVQDKINLIDDTLHITPGVTLEGTYSSFTQSNVFSFPAGFQYIAFKSTKWDRELLPFFNITYDLDKVLPSLKGLSIYGSTASSALFAPTTDFGPNAAGSPPYASIVHLYEGGITYNSSDILLKADYFYQKVDRDFGFFQAQSGPDVGENIYTSSGQREFKGFEAAATWNVNYVPGLQFFGNVSHTLAKYLTNSFAFATVAEDQFGIALKGAPITGIPNWLSTFGADYTRKSTLLDGDRFDVRVTEEYTGSQSTTYDITGNAVIPSFQGLEPSGPCAPLNIGSGCTRFVQESGATVYDPNGGISSYVVTNLDLNYTMPTPNWPMLKKLKFDLNVQNLFNNFHYQYFFKQIAPSSCSATKSNPVASPYGCTPEFADGIPGQPASVFFTVTARF